MTMIVRLEGLSRLRDFLKWTAQPQVAYPWYDDDSIRVEIQTEQTRRASKTYIAYVTFNDVSHYGEMLKDVVELVGGKILREVPPQVKRSYPPQTMASTIERFRLSKSLRSGRMRQELLIALYDVDSSQLADVFASVPKSPDQPATVTFLEQNGGPDGDAEDRPKFYIRLLQPDRGFHWGVWLEATNREMSSGKGACVQLFYRLPGGRDAEFFVEHGWSHPLPELCELYPNHHGAACVLIAGQRRDGEQDTHWIHLVPSPGDRRYGMVDTDEDPVQVVLQDEPLNSVVHAVVPTEQLRLTPRIVEISAERRARLDSVDRRIQGVKDTLFHLERQRATLLGRERDRFRFLLGFKQDPPKKGEASRLAASFQRFLRLSRRQLDDFLYVYHDELNGGGRHLILTREAVFSQDVYRTLADDVYYQQQAWADWGVSFFVRDNCHVLPNLDRDLAVKLNAALEAAGGDPADGEGTPILLLEPAEGTNDQLKISRLSMPVDSVLAKQINFINTEHPATECQSRTMAKEKLATQLAGLQVNLEQDVEKMERSFKDQATKRLQRAQECWNDIGPKIDQTVGILEHCHDQADVLDQVLGDFDETWNSFLEKVITLNSGLIQVKLDALKKLSAKRGEWPKILDETKKANQNVPALLADTRAEMAPRIVEARAKHLKAKEQFEKVERETLPVLKEVRELCSEINKHLAEAKRIHGAIEGKNKQLTSKNREASTLNKRLRASCTELEALRKGFQQHLDEARKQANTTAEIVKQLDKLHKEVDETFLEWQVNLGIANKQADALAVKCREKGEQIHHMEDTLATKQREADKAASETEDAYAVVTASQTLLEGKLRKSGARLAAIRVQAAILREADRQLKEQDSDLEREASILGKAATELSGTLRGVDSANDEGLAKLVSHMSSTAGSLQMLAEMEVALRPYNVLRKLIVGPDVAARTYRAFRPLTNVDPEGRLWRRRN